MFEIAIDITYPTAQRQDYLSMSIDEIFNYISFDGHLTIINNNQTVFSEDVPVVEFYWYLSKWYREGGIKKKELFKYYTVENDDSVLVFSNDFENRWKISSPWIKTETPCFVTGNELDSQIKKILNDIGLVIEQQN